MLSVPVDAKRQSIHCEGQQAVIGNSNWNDYRPYVSPNTHNLRGLTLECDDASRSMPLGVPIGSATGERAPASTARHPDLVGLVRFGRRPARGLGSHCRDNIFIFDPLLPSEPALSVAGPLSNLLFVSLLGLLLAFAARRWPRFGRWFGPRVIAFLSILPVVSLLGPRIYPAAWAVFALGAALCLASFLEQHEPVLRRRMLVSFPGLLCIALILAGSVCWSEWLARRNESSRPLPPGNPPNILLITLDTVGANHLSLYGYSRPTSPVLERLAGSGIRFDQARATAPWTLPSHATMFTSRWHHDLNVDWSTPLDKKHRTLAEHLGSHGYATAGFVANLFSCPTTAD